MSPRKTPHCGRTSELFDWTPPEVPRFDEDHIRAVTLAARLSKAVSRVLKDAEAPRKEIASGMTDYLGATITEDSLNALAAESKDDHVISLPRLLALMHVTKDHRPFVMLAELSGMEVIERRYKGVVEEAMVAEQVEYLQGRLKELRRGRK